MSYKSFSFLVQPWTEAHGQDYLREKSGLWGVECIPAVIGTGGPEDPLRQSNTTSLIGIVCDASRAEGARSGRKWGTGHR
eukprot:1181159-Prorocentrum_minimum.AAC.2